MRPDFLSRREQSAPTSRRHRPDLMLIVFTSILVLLGLIVIYAISPPLIARAVSAGQDIDPNHYMFRQLIYILAGVVGFAIFFTIPVDFWRKFAGKILIGGMALGTLPFLLQATSIGRCTNDACRWLDLGVVSFQPAEAMKLALVIFLASFLALRLKQGRINDRQHTIIPVMVILLILAGLVIGLQSDLGTGVTIFGIVMTMLFVAGLKVRWVGIILACAIALAGVFTLIAPSRIERLLTFIQHSSATNDDMSYHINQALIAIGSGGATGKGLGQSVQAFGYLPEATNDSIFAILAEIFGFLGTVGILVVFAMLFLRLLKIMDQSQDSYYKLIVAGVFGWIFSHTIVNIAAMLGIFPLTGITLPFVSFGGSSLLFMLCALGLVLQISRYSTHQLPGNSVTGGTNEDRRRRRGIGRARHTLFGSFSRT